MVTTHQDWLDAQVGVLGSVLIDPSLASKIVSETKEDDYTGHYRTIYKTICRLFMAGKPADPVMINDALGGAYTDLLLKIMEVTPSAACVDYYIGACLKKGRLLQLRDLGVQLQQAQDMDEMAEILELANSVSAQRSRYKPVTMEEALARFFDRRDKPREYLSWPVDGLDGRLFAERGDFIIIAGYPSDGKSALAMQCAYHLARNARVGIFSLETNPDKLTDRMMAYAARLPLPRIKTGAMAEHEWEHASRLSSEIISRQLEFVPASGISVAEIRAVSLANRYDVIFVDYIQLVRGNRRDRYSEVTGISLDFHTMAQSTGITVIGLSQLNRPEVRKDGSYAPPGLSNLRESGQIEQDADIVLMVYRPHPDRDERMLLVRKNKEGECGSMELDFDGQHQTFSRRRGIE